MADHASFASYKDLLLVLAIAAILVPILARYRINSIFGYLLAGAALGPDGLGRLAGSLPWLGTITVTERGQIVPLAEAGVMCLLFMIGLELSFERLKTMRRVVFGFGASQVVLSAIVLLGALLIIRIEPQPALILSLAFALSSTALVIQMLAGAKRLGSSTGRLAFPILLFQDIAVVPILVLIGVMAGAAQDNVLLQLGLSLAKAVLAVGGILLLGRFVLRPVFRSVARAKSADLFMAACLLVVIGTGLITAASGLSSALGAFIAGLILAETEFRREVEATIEPFKGLLIGAFFFSVGMSLDVMAVLAQPGTILALLLVFLVLKGAIILLIARFSGAKPGTAIELALLLAPAGEFAFVMLTVAGTNGLIAGDALAIGTAVAALSMVINPMLALWGQRIKQRLEPATAVAVTAQQTSQPAHLPDLSDPPRAIIVGFGRVGELVANMLDHHKVKYLAIDSDPDIAARARKQGREIYLGDATSIDFLRRCGFDTARVLVVTMDNRKAVEAVTRTAHAHAPELVIVARARDPQQAAQLYAAGATEAVPEAIEASLHISEAALIAAGVPLGFVIASVHEQRDQYRSTFQRINRQERDPMARLRARRVEVKKTEG